MTVDDVVGAAFLPTDGQASPSDIVQALAARRAQRAASTIREDMPVTAHPRRGRRACAASRPPRAASPARSW